MDILSKLPKDIRAKLCSAVIDDMTQRDESLLNQHRIDTMHLKRMYNRRLLEAEDEKRGVCYDKERSDREHGTPPAMVVPVVGPITETAAAALVNIFLATPEVFPIAQQPGREHVVEAYNALLRKYASSFGWRSALSAAIVKGVRHNFAAVEVGWKRRSVKVLSNALASDGSIKAKSAAETGVAIKSLDSYNVFWDQSVLPEDVAAQGDFAGYVETYSTVRLIGLLKELNSPIKQSSKEFVALCKGAPSKSVYTDHRPNSTTKRTDWASILQLDVVPTSDTSLHEVVTMYCRTVPAAYGLKKFPNSEDVVVWKLTVVDGSYLAAAEQLTNVHGLIPILLCRPSAHDPDSDWGSLTSELAPYQKLATTLWAAELSAVRKAARERLLYDPSKLNNPEELAVVDGDSHVAVKGSAIGAGLENIVKPLGVNPGPLGVRINEAAQVVQMANLAGGQNAVQQGAFVRGNKTNEQFRQTISGTSSRTQLLAIRLEDAMMARVREIIASDMLQYQTAVTVYDPTTGESINVDPKLLRETAVSFEMADGLVAVNDKVTPELLASVFQTVVANPNASAEFRTTDLIVHLLAQSGVRGLHAFKKSRQELANEQAAATAAAGVVPVSGAPSDPGASQ